MGRKVWLAIAVAALVAVSFAASGLAAKHSGESRNKYSTRGLDYLHSRQIEGGGFGSPWNTAWAILGAVAKNERMGSTAWTIKGVNPVGYLQATDLAAAASDPSVGNVPVYYARLIMAYVAAGKSDKVASAGSKAVNLLTLMNSYQDMSDTSLNKGAYLPTPPTTNDAIHTTAWAILAMNAVETDTSSDPHFQAAVAWLAKQQNDLLGGDGGFSSSVKGQASNVVDTGLAVQALEVPGYTWTADGENLANSYLVNEQNRGDGGFPYSGSGTAVTDATASAIQAILAMGQDPKKWPVESSATRATPYTALNNLLQRNGSYLATSRADTLAATSWALVAQTDVSKSFDAYPKKIPAALKAFKFRPEFRYVAPHNGAKYKDTRTVLIRATYTDFYPKGTGINPKTTRVYVDDKNRSGKARISRYSLHLQLKNVPVGDHTYQIDLHDYAGNSKSITRKFSVVAHVIPTPTYTPQPTYIPTYRPTTYPTYTPTPSHTVTPVPTYTPTPYETVTPYPWSSPSASGSAGPISGSPIPSASGSPSPSAGKGGGSAAGFVGGTLLAMLPIGAVLSYLFLHRREDLLGTASQGTVLSGGGSSWERFKSTLARSKDLTRPTNRD